MAKQAKKPSDVVVHNNRKGATLVPGLGLLRPGANVVSAAALEDMKRQTTVAETGKSNLPPGLLTIDEGKPAQSAGREQDDAIALVKDTFDVETLKGMLDVEKRPRVRSAIQEQIDALTKEPPKDDETGEEK